MNSVQTTSIEHQVGAEGLVLVRVRSGSVRVRGTDGDVARVTDEEGHDLGDLAVERGDGSLSLSVRKGLRIETGARRRSEPSLALAVPRRATLVVEAGSADLVGEDLAGDQRYQTVSGDVSLRGVRGTVSVDAVSGDVRLSASGELRLRARTVSGDLTARAGRLAEVALATTSGDLSLAGELARDGEHRIETVSGDTLLALAGGVRIEVSSVTGDVQADVPHRAEGGRGRRVVLIGDAGATLVARSMSGDVRIVAPRPFETGPDEPDRDAVVLPRQSAASLDAPVPEPAQPGPSEAAIAAAYEDARLGILRGLERGEIDVAEAGRRLEALDTADVPGGRTDA